jgi:hypothetical protein
VAAGEMPEWATRQELQISTSGLMKISLPESTLDRARADLADLRLIGPEGREVAYLIERQRPADQSPRGVPGFRVTLAPETTVIVVETGTSEPLEGITLQTPADAFIKAGKLEGSPDTQNWELLGNGIPLFRQEQGREEQVYLALSGGSWRFLRITLDDRASAPVPFTGALLHPAPAPSPTEPAPVRVTAREEIGGESRLTIDLGAAHLPLAEIEIDTPEPFFRRQIRLIARQIEGITIEEKVLARGIIHRTTRGNHAGLDPLRLPRDLQTPRRELLLVIENGDSPPLRVDQVKARRWPVRVVFWSQPGSHRIYTGNPVCRLPEYDLSIPDQELRQTPVTPVELLPPVPNPGHQAAASWPKIDELAGRLELAGWGFRKPVGIESAGVQQLELDLETMAHAQSGYADLRLMIEDRQVPYILERRSIPRSFKAVVRSADSRDRPHYSRWSLGLPHSNLPVTRLTCKSGTTLFRREMVLFEEPIDPRGGQYRRELGRVDWVQAPDRAAQALLLDLRGSPITDTLYLETDNEDNPPLQITGIELEYRTAQLYFKADLGAPLSLYYGNERVGAPQYDLSLVAEQIIASDKVPAFLGTAEQLRGGLWDDTRLARKGGIVFWTSLVLVVIGLLLVITRLVPKPNTPNPP